jgi:hypothetical protein
MAPFISNALRLSWRTWPTKAVRKHWYFDRRNHRFLGRVRAGEEAADAAFRPPGVPCAAGREISI